MTDGKLQLKHAPAAKQSDTINTKSIRKATKYRDSRSAKFREARYDKMV